MELAKNTSYEKEQEPFLTNIITRNEISNLTFYRKHAVVFTHSHRSSKCGESIIGASLLHHPNAWNKLIIYERCRCANNTNVVLLNLFVDWNCCTADVEALDNVLLPSSSLIMVSS